MSYYGGTITVLGRDLITSLVAGETIEFTRILVGKGSMPEGVEPIDMTELVEPVAEGASTVPVVDNGVITMTVEYRNDMNGGLKDGFWLREFGVFAKTENSEEVLLYYATLGDSPQPVNAYQDNRIDIRRYPITISLALEANVQVVYNPGAFITAGEAQELIDAMVNDAVGNVVKDAASAIITTITIPADAWQKREFDDKSNQTYSDEYVYFVDVESDGCMETMFPTVALDKSSLEPAGKAGLCPTAQSLSGSIRFWAKKVPESALEATVALLGESIKPGSGGGSYVLPTATATRLGGVKVGEGLQITEDGTISTVTDFATSDDMEAMLEEAFNEKS